MNESVRLIDTVESGKVIKKRVEKLGCDGGKVVAEP